CTYDPSGIPFVIAVHVFPKSVVLKIYGLKSSSLCRSTATYALLASCGDGSMRSTVLQSGIFGVTFEQCWPSSLVTWTNPSSVPVQIVPFFIGDSASAKIVS